MHKRLTYILLAAIFFAANHAEAAKRKTGTPASPPPTLSETVLNSYADSLAARSPLRDTARTDSVAPAGKSAELYRLFAPTTYYSDITAGAFAMEADTASLLSRTLMTTYLRRPELVRLSADRLRRQSSDEALKKKPASTTAKKADKSAAAVTAAIAGIPEDGGDNHSLYVVKPNFWQYSGDYYMQFMQNYVSANWYKSGSNNYSLLGAVTLQLNYDNKQKVKWDNKLEMKLGFMTTEADTVNNFKTSEDLLRYTSKLGLQAFKRWYYTFQLIANTQFCHGLKNNDEKVYSDFFSPFNLNLSVGMDYSVATNNNKLTGNVHLAPLAYNFKYVGREALATSFGLKEGHRTLSDWGSQFTVDLVWKPVDMFSWQARIYGYTTYHKYEMEWENTLTFQFNKYISAKLFLYPRFDDSATRMDDMSYFQFKEYLSVGFGYSM